MKIITAVPMRIDLAGGTLDVYPLYLFEGGGLTVNAAIDIGAGIRLTTRDDQRLILRSEDLGVQREFASLDEVTPGGDLDLIKRALLYFRPEMGLQISVRSTAPAGSGLGASSAILIALLHTLNRLTERGLSRTQLVDLATNLEAQVIGIPTGKQDYIPALYGGVCSIWFDVDGWRYESLSVNPTVIKALNLRLLVSYTGESRPSALTNWAMLRRYIEREGDTVERLRQIKQVAIEMREALLKLDMVTFTKLVNAEWRLRRGLADGVSTKQIEGMMAAAASAGAVASKVCGAGGGGCMISIIDPYSSQAVTAALQSVGARVLPTQITPDGLTEEITEEESTSREA